MATARKLNEIAESSSSSYISFDALEIGKPYKVLGFSAFKSEMFNKVRTCVRVEIEEGMLILPERFDNSLHRILKMNTEKLYIVFNGRDAKRMNRLNIDFEEE